MGRTCGEPDEIKKIPIRNILPPFFVIRDNNGTIEPAEFTKMLTKLRMFKPSAGVGGGVTGGGGLHDGSGGGGGAGAGADVGSAGGGGGGSTFASIDMDKSGGITFAEFFAHMCTEQ